MKMAKGSELCPVTYLEFGQDCGLYLFHFYLHNKRILRYQLSFGTFPFAVIIILYLHFKSSPQLDVLQLRSYKNTCSNLRP